jgi:PTS system cellobiose-specific IIC component
MFKLPEGVPEGVAKSFEAILPSFIIILTFWILRDVLDVALPNIINMLFNPVMKLGDSLVAVLLLTIIDSVVWFAGIHPVAITGPYFRIVALKLLTENADVASAAGLGAVLPHIAVDQFYFWFVWVGGSGATLGLVILLLFAKSKLLKNLGNICSIPGIFNINEPVVFGLPIIGNPLMIIPFALAPFINGIISYMAFYFNLVQRPYIMAPWTLPAPLGALYSTGGDWRAFILSCISIIVSVVIYYPFFRVFDQQMLAKEKEEENGVGTEKEKGTAEPAGATAQG